MGSASPMTSKVAQLPRLVVPIVLYTPRDLKTPSNRKIVIPFISYGLHCVVEQIRVSTFGAQISSWPWSLMCWGDPCQDSSLAHGVTAGRSCVWKGGDIVCAATSLPVHMQQGKCPCDGARAKQCQHLQPVGCEGKGAPSRRLLGM